MTAIVLPDIDKATIDDLVKKIPDLREIELPNLPKMKDVSKTADDTIDRLLGRSRAPVWPWIAAGIAIVGVIGAVAAYVTWWRRPSWETPSETWSTSTPTEETYVPEQTTPDSTESTGLTAAEASLTSSSYGGSTEI
ncbi:MAG TPA: hypothetical protein VHR16_04675 [Candidatus Limnocylindrales bacterium]|jgi:hypothetical protein|nr:hypothetical protein [Candidatus Limnocylindrales bacterium]